MAQEIGWFIVGCYAVVGIALVACFAWQFLKAAFRG
jgi:hypothetical protein